MSADSSRGDETVGSWELEASRSRVRSTGRRPLVMAAVMFATALATSRASLAQAKPSRARDISAVGSPRAIISGAEIPGATGFVRLTAAAVLPGDLLVVADDGNVQLSVFDRTGRFVRHVGHQGRGPGEYRGVDALQVRHDTIVVIDGRSAVHLYHSSGKWLLSRRLPTVDGYLTNPAIGLLGPRDILLRLYPVSAPLPPGTVVEDSIHVWKWDGAGVPRPLAVVPTARVHRHPTARAQYMTLFSPFTTYAVSGGQLCYAYPREYRVRCLDANGTPSDRVDEPRVAARVTAREVAAARRRLAGYDASGRNMYAEPTLRAHRERVASHVAAESLHPVMGGILAASDGAIWVRQYTPALGMIASDERFVEHPSTWVEYGQDGTPTKRAFRVPARHWVTAIDGRRIIAIVRDEDDVEDVRVYELEP